MSGSSGGGPLLVFGDRSLAYDFGPHHPLTPKRFGPGIDLLRAVGATPGLAPEPATDDGRTTGARGIVVVTLCALSLLAHPGAVFTLMAVPIMWPVLRPIIRIHMTAATMAKKMPRRLSFTIDPPPCRGPSRIRR